MKRHGFQARDIGFFPSQFFFEDALLPAPSFSSRLVKDTDISLAAKRVSVVRAQDLFVPSQYYRSLATRAGEGRCRTVCAGRTDSVLHVFQSRMFLFIRFLFDGAVAAAVHASVRRLAKLVIAVQ